MDTHQNPQAEPRQETEEEHAVRLRKISEEVKADMKAGRYRHGQLRPEISAVANEELLRKHEEYYQKYADLTAWQEQVMKSMIYGEYGLLVEEKTISRSDFYEMYGGRTVSGRYTGRHAGKVPLVWFDEVHHIKDWHSGKSDRSPKEEKDWERTMFKQDSLSSTPSKATRAKLRAKRKKRK